MPTTGTLRSVHFCSLLSPSIDISSYLMPKPTMCDIGCAGHNPPAALKYYFASPIVWKPQLFSPLFFFLLQEGSIFLGDRGTEVTWNKLHYPHGHAGHHALFLQMELRSSSFWPIFCLTQLCGIIERSEGPAILHLIYDILFGLQGETRDSNSSSWWRLTVYAA